MNTPYGYTSDENEAEYSINPDEASEVRELIGTQNAPTTTPIDRAAIYARSATAQERGSSNALDSQIHDCREYAAQQGFQVTEQHIYHEIWSGAQYQERPQLTLLREAAKRGEFDLLIVSSFDRLSRKQQHVEVLLSELESCNVRVESLSEPTGLRDLHHALIAFQTFEHQSRMQKRKATPSNESKEGRND